MSKVKFIDSRGGSLTIDKIYKVIGSNEEEYQIIDDDGIQSWYLKNRFIDLIESEVDAKESKQEILSLSQPNMRVGGWVKYNSNTDRLGFEKNKYYEIAKTRQNFTFDFDVKNSNNKIISDFGCSQQKFDSTHFDCNNAMPYNPNETLSKIEVDVVFDKELSDKFNNDIKRVEQKQDMVNSPPHYTFSGIECLDAIKAQLGKDGYIAFLRGQIAKYNWRIMHKNNPLEDAKKIQFYTNKLVEELEDEE